MGVSAAHWDTGNDPTQNIAYFFMNIIIQELLNMNVLVSEMDLNILQWIIQLCC